VSRRQPALHQAPWPLERGRGLRCPYRLPQFVANRLWVDILLDVMLVASLFVLGGNFWDKLRTLFVADARAVFPAGA
jgi:hypothetical protein